MRLAAALLALVLFSTACGRREVSTPVAERTRRVEQFVIPAGSTISLRTVSRIDAKNTIPAEGFAAVVAGNVGDALTAGAPARLVILPGQLGLGAVMVEGNWLPMSAPLGTLVKGILDSRLAQLPGSENQSTAIRVTGDDIQVPAGTLLIFRTEQAIQSGLRPGA